MSSIPVSPIRLSGHRKKEPVAESKAESESDENYGEEDFGDEEEEEDDFDSCGLGAYEEHEDHWADAAEAKEVDDLACVVLDKLKLGDPKEDGTDSDDRELLDILKVLKDICITGVALWEPEEVKPEKPKSLHSDWGSFNKMRAVVVAATEKEEKEKEVQIPQFSPAVNAVRRFFTQKNKRRKEKELEEICTGDQTIICLVHECCIMTPLMDILDNILNELESLKSQEASGERRAIHARRGTVDFWRKRSVGSDIAAGSTSRSGNGKGGRKFTKFSGENWLQNMPQTQPEDAAKQEQKAKLAAEWLKVYATFAARHANVMSGILSIFKHCCRVVALKPLLASPEIALIPLVGSILSQFSTNDLTDDIINNILACLENLSKFITLSPRIRIDDQDATNFQTITDNSSYFSPQDALMLLKALLQVCYDHEQFDSDMQTRAFTCLCQISEKSMENSQWITMHYELQEKQRLARRALALKGMKGGDISNNNNNNGIVLGGPPVNKSSSPPFASGRKRTIGLPSIHNNQNHPNPNQSNSSNSNSGSQNQNQKSLFDKSTNSTTSTTTDGAASSSTSSGSCAETGPSDPKDNDKEKEKEKIEAKIENFDDTLLILAGILKNFISGRLQRSQKANMYYTFDVLLSLSSHVLQPPPDGGGLGKGKVPSNGICHAIFTSAILPPLIAIIDFSHHTEQSAKGMQVLFRLSRCVRVRSLLVRKAMAEADTLGGGVLGVLLRHIAEANDAGRMHAIRILRTMAAHSAPKRTVEVYGVSGPGAGSSADTGADSSARERDRTKSMDSVVSEGEGGGGDSSGDAAAAKDEGIRFLMLLLQPRLGFVRTLCNCLTPQGADDKEINYNSNTSCEILQLLTFVASAHIQCGVHLSGEGLTPFSLSPTHSPISTSTSGAGADVVEVEDEEVVSVASVPSEVEEEDLQGSVSVHSKSAGSGEGGSASDEKGPAPTPGTDSGPSAPPMTPRPRPLLEVMGGASDSSETPPPLLLLIERVLHSVPAFEKRTFDPLSLEPMKEEEVAANEKTKSAAGTGSKLKGKFGKISLKSLAKTVVAIQHTHHLVKGDIDIDPSNPLKDKVVFDKLPECIVDALALVAVLASDTAPDTETQQCTPTLQALLHWKTLPVILSYLVVNDKEVFDKSTSEGLAEGCILLTLSSLLTAPYGARNALLPREQTADASDVLVARTRKSNRAFLRECGLRLCPSLVRKLCVHRSHGRRESSTLPAPHHHQTKLALCLFILLGADVSLDYRGNSNAPLPPPFKNHTQGSGNGEEEDPETRQTEDTTESMSYSEKIRSSSIFEVLLRALQASPSTTNLKKKGADGASKDSHTDSGNSKDQAHGSGSHKGKGDSRSGSGSGAGLGLGDKSSEDEPKQWVRRFLSLLEVGLEDWRNCAVRTTMTLYADLPLSDPRNSVVNALGALKPEPVTGTFSSVMMVPRQLTLYAQRQVSSQDQAELGVPAPLAVWVIPPSKPPTPSSFSSIEQDQEEDEEQESFNRQGQQISSNDRDEGDGRDVGDNVTLALADISPQELMDRGADIPLEGWLLALLHLCRGAAADGLPGGQFSSPHLPPPPLTHLQKKKGLPVPHLNKFRYGWNALHQFLCTPSMASLMVDLLVVSFHRAGFRERLTGELLEESASTQKSHADAQPKFDRAYYSRCTHHLVNCLLYLTQLYSHSCPHRLIIDLFPKSKSDPSAGGTNTSVAPPKPHPCFFRLMTLLTQLTNVLTAPISTKVDERENGSTGVIGIGVGIGGGMGGHDGDMRAKKERDLGLGRACKALYRSMRDALADFNTSLKAAKVGGDLSTTTTTTTTATTASTTTNEEGSTSTSTSISVLQKNQKFMTDEKLFSGDGLRLFSLTLGGEKLFQMGHLKPKLDPLRLDRAPKADESLKHICFSYYAGNDTFSYRYGSNISTARVSAVEKLAVKLEKEMDDTMVWTYSRGSACVPPLFQGETCSSPPSNLNDSSALGGDTVLKAMDVSDLVVIFVSRDYSACPVCRQEAYHAAQLSKDSHCRVIFIMQEETYQPLQKHHTLLQGVVLDENAAIKRDSRERPYQMIPVLAPSKSTETGPVVGWLRRIIGKSFWFALWDIKVHSKYLPSWLIQCEKADFRAPYLIPETYYRKK